MICRKQFPHGQRDLAATCAKRAIKRVPTQHRLILADSRNMDDIEDGERSSRGHFTTLLDVKEYPVQEGQLGRIGDYEQFLENLDEVWKKPFAVLVKGGS